MQVLNEFVAAVRRKYRMPWKEIREALATLRLLCPKPALTTLEIHEAGLSIAEKHGYQIYDSLIIATAIAAGCNILYSEDLQDGQVIDDLTIRNPFRKPH